MADDLAALLAQKEEEYAQLGEWIRLTRAMLGQSAGREGEDGQGDAHPAHRHQPRHSAQRRSIGTDEFVGLSTSQAVRKFLEMMGKGNPQGPRDMAKALVAGGRDKDEEKAYSNVQSVLKRLKKDGEIRQVRRGLWGLSSWYGSPPRKGE